MFRKVGFYESYNKYGYELLAGDGMVLTLARISGPLTDQDLREGLLTLQKRHPLLRSGCVEVDTDNDHFNTNTYDTLSDDERRDAIPILEIPRNDERQWCDVAARECIPPIEAYSPWLWRLVWLRGQSDHELILYSRHEITDATSSIYLLAQLVALLGNRAVGGDISHLIQPLDYHPPVETLLPSPSQTGAESPGPDLVPWPYDRWAPVGERVPIALFSKMDIEIMEALNKRRKQEGVTVNSALSAAFFLAEFETFHSATPGATVLFKTAISLRDRCTPAVSNEHLGTYVMPVANVLHGMGQKSFWDLAREIGAGLLSEIEKLENTGFLPSTFEKQDVIATTHAGYAATTKGRCFGEGPWMSNLGRLPFEPHYGPFQLKEMYFGTKQVAGDAGCVLSIVTLHGRILSCLTTAEPLMRKSTAEKIFARYHQLLSENL